MPQSPPLSRPWLPAPFACLRGSDGWDSVWIQPTGELDLATCPLFEQALKGAQDDASVVSIDLQELTFVDCAGLTAIVHAAARAAATKKRLILVGATGQVERLFDLTGPLRTVEVVKFKQVGNGLR